jgi:hypothetical protein
MPRTREELERAAAEAEAWLNSLNPDETPAEDAADLRRIGLAVIARADAETEIIHAVVDARRNGRSWGEIAMVLGTSKQAARERYGQLVDDPRQ